MSDRKAEKLALTVLSNLQDHMHEHYLEDRKGMRIDELAESDMDEYHAVTKPIADVRKMIEEHLL
jgi:hypothetical protein